MKRLIVKGITVAMLGAVLAFPLATPVFADTNPMQTPTTGQPGASSGVSCGSGNATSTPGGSGSSPGAPFAGGTADSHYAGNPNTASLAHSNSTAAVSQYDVACLRFTTRP